MLGLRFTLCWMEDTTTSTSQARTRSAAWPGVTRTLSCSKSTSPLSGLNSMYFKLVHNFLCLEAAQTFCSTSSNVRTVSVLIRTIMVSLIVQRDGRL